VSVEAARLLLERDIVGLRIDTLSPDSPHSKFAVHQLLLSNEKYIVENVANTDKLPPTGSWCLIAPLKIAGGTEAPVRLIGLIKR
jgi:kynurenine formamidase